MRRPRPGPSGLLCAAALLSSACDSPPPACAEGSAGFTLPPGESLVLLAKLCGGGDDARGKIQVDELQAYGDQLTLKVGDPAGEATDRAHSDFALGAEHCEAGVTLTLSHKSKQEVTAALTIAVDGDRDTDCSARVEAVP